jgi:hypothetical protein
MGVGEQAGRPGDGIQHTLVKVGDTAVTDPAGDGQHEVDTHLVGDLR